MIIMDQAEGYLDMHSHILPGVDDGAKDWEMTEQMLQKAYQQGVRQIVATPHNYPGRRRQENAEILKLAEEADQRAKKIAPDLQVLCGNEIYYRGGIAEEVKSGHALPMAGGRHLLIEFHPNEAYGRIYQGVKELVEEGYDPVIAHMERVQELFSSEDRLREIIKTGARIQVNCESLVGGMFDRRASRLRKMIESGLVHFLGSDCHNLTSRPPVMKDCANLLYKKLPKERVDSLLYENKKLFLRSE